MSELALAHFPVIPGKKHVRRHQPNRLAKWGWIEATGAARLLAGVRFSCKLGPQ